MIYRHLDDPLLVVVLKAVGVTDFGLRRLCDLRAQNERNPMEVTIERKRLDFLKIIYDLCAIGRDDREPTPQTILDMGWLDFAGGRSTQAPEYSGG